MQKFINLLDPNLHNVLLGTILLSISSSVMGTFAFLKRRTLINDAIAHAVLPGSCLAFCLKGEKNSICLVIGAFITGWLGSIAVTKITTHSKIKQDTAIALIASISFGFGSFLLSILQHSGQADQGGIKSFLLGSAATLLRKDVVLLFLLSLLIILTIFLFFKEFLLIAFDSLFAESIGIPVKKMDLLFTSLMVLAIIVGINLVGIVLMSAMLITPAAIARFWTGRVFFMIFWAVLVSIFSSFSGTYISYIIPSMPTGPWIVLIMSLIAYFSFFAAWLYRYIKYIFLSFREE